MNAELMVPIVFFAAVFGIVYVITTARHKERMALIEFGIDPKSLEVKRINKLRVLKNGLLSVGISVGLVFGHVLESLTRMSDEVAYGSMVFLFGGLSLLGFYIWAKDKQVD